MLNPRSHVTLPALRVRRLFCVVLSLFFPLILAGGEPSSSDPDEAALLKAIWSHPAEDTPRLVYADCLDEQGKAERAQFIRLQCAQARDWTSERQTEIDALATKHAQEWTPQWLREQHTNGNLGELRFSRGFLEYVEVLQPSLLMDETNKFFDNVPFLSALKINGASVVEGQARTVRHYYARNLVDRLVTRPEMARITAFGYTARGVALDHEEANLFHDSLTKLLDKLPALRELSLRHNLLSENMARTIANHPRTRALEYFQFRMLDTQPALANVVRILLNPAHFPHLKELDVSFNLRSLLDIITEYSEYPNLRALSARSPLLPTTNTLQHFFQTPTARRLQYLFEAIRPISGLAPDDEGLVGLSEGQYRDQVRQILNEFFAHENHIEKLDSRLFHLLPLNLRSQIESRQQFYCDKLVYALSGQEVPLPRYFGVYQGSNKITP